MMKKRAFKKKNKKIKKIKCNNLDGNEKEQLRNTKKK